MINKSFKMLGTRGKIIVSITHFLVVERSYFLKNNKYSIC